MGQSKHYTINLLKILKNQNPVILIPSLCPTKKLMFDPSLIKCADEIELLLKIPLHFRKLWVELLFTLDNDVKFGLQYN